MSRYQHELHIDKPTRVTPHSATLIDHIWSSDPEYIHQAEEVPAGISDHHLVLIVRRQTNVTQHQQRQHAQLSYRSFKNFDSDVFIHDLELCDWSDIYTTHDPETAWNKFVTNFNNIADKHAPLKEHRIKAQSTYWMNDEVLEAIRKRDYVHNKFLKTKKEQYHQHYRKMRNYVVNLIQRTKAQFFETTVEENRFNPKNMWKQLKLALPSSKSKLPNQIRTEHEILENPKQIADEFNRFFSTVAQKLTENLPVYEKEKYQRKVSDDTKFTIPPMNEQYVVKQIESMGNGKATGLDNISVRLLKIAKNAVSRHITHILNMSIQSGHVPSLMKAARVVPIHKSGDVEDTNNYRPISVLPTVSKILERYIHGLLYDYLESLNLIAKSQSGFRHLHSTATALVKVYDQLLESIDAGKLIGVVFIDLKKAFDTVNHNILIDKLESYGIDGTELQWFKSYMSERTQKVDFVGTLSEKMSIDIGVPQGSILGPLLFILFVNDIQSVVEGSQIDLYADDTTIQSADKDINNIEKKLNKDLENINNWLVKNRLILNAKKTVCMLIGTHQRLSKLEKVKLNIKVGDSVLTQVSEAKLLGVHIDPHLSWQPHIHSLCSKVSKKLGLLRRLRKVMPHNTMKTIYNTLVLPLMDYADIIWGTAAQTHVNEVFKLQKRAARILMGASRYAHTTPILRQLNWLTVQQRVKLHRAVLMYKATHKLAPKYISEKFIRISEINSKRNTRASHRGDFVVPKPRLEIFKKSLVYTGATEWNTLPTDIKDCQTVDSFKHHYIKYLKHEM